MWLLKTNTQFALIIFLILSNFWIYRILKENFFVGIILIVSTFLVAVFWEKRNSFVVILSCIVLLLLFQYQTTKPQSLTILENDQQRVQQERIRSYPPTYIDLYFKVLWLKPADWIEKNNLIIGLSRIEQNIFENLNINKFFFGGFPRNSNKDFEKFPFFLLPIFIIGVYKMIKDKKSKTLFTISILPIVFLSVTGNENVLGPFVLFPFFVTSFVNGIKFMESGHKNKASLLLCNKKLIYGSLILFVTLGFILQLSYGQK